MPSRRPPRFVPIAALVATVLAALAVPARAQRTTKPVLHGAHWVAITGKPLAATAGARTFMAGGNAVDAACAMLAATCTMWDTLSWGGETQALIYNPHTGEVKGIDALGVAPTGATPDFFRSRGMRYPPEFGPLAAVTPGTPGGLMVMLAEFGTMSLEQVLAPAMEMAAGYPIEQQLADTIERHRDQLAQWPDSKRVLLPHLGEPGGGRAAPYPGEIFRQPDLLATLGKLVATERAARAAGKSRKEAIYAAYDRFYRGDIARELVRSVHEQGGLITLDDLDRWQVHVEEPVTTRYKGIDVYKLTTWVQGPVMLQALNLLENVPDLKGMGYDSAAYLHTLYQVMNLAYADRDFYYGDPYVPPAEPIRGLLSKEYAKARFAGIDWDKNDPTVKPGDPYPFQGETNPYADLLAAWTPNPKFDQPDTPAAGAQGADLMTHDEAFVAGTTSIEAADAEGWVVSVTPSGGWVPAVIAGATGVGLSERMQSFVLDRRMNPFNVVQPGQRPRATLTPTLALRDGKPLLAFAVQGGDTQDQNLLQFFLDVVEFGMNVQQAVEAANLTSFQMQSSFGDHRSEPGRIVVRDDVPAWVQAALRRKGYRVETEPKTSGPITAIYLDRVHDTLWGGASDYGEDYGIAW
jgi:gamma-glutamyltranspeptidase / glutathione hydrolase